MSNTPDQAGCGCFASPYYSLCSTHAEQYRKAMEVRGYVQRPNGFVYDPNSALLSRVVRTLERVELLLQKLEEQTK